MKLHTKISLILLATCISAFAQEQKKSELAISVAPQYLLMRGLRVNIEKKLNDRNSFQISPLLFYSTTHEVDATTTGDLVAFGCELSKMYKLTNDKSAYGPFVQYGASVVSSKVSYNGQVWSTVIVDELTVMQLKTKYLSKTFNQFGVSTTVGYKVNFGDDWFVDYYIGIGGKYTILSFDYFNDNKNLDSNPWDFGYTGFLVLMGFNVGVFVR